MGRSELCDYCEVHSRCLQGGCTWRRNSFLVPSGMIGKKELARLYQTYADNTTLHSIAVTVCFVLEVLLLQKPYAKSESKGYVACLECCLALWHAGDFAALISEGKCIHDHLQSVAHQPGQRNIARLFDRLMSMGKVSTAVKLIFADAGVDIFTLESHIATMWIKWDWLLFNSISEGHSH